MYGLRYNREHRLISLRQDGGFMIVVKIFRKDVQIFTGRLGPRKVQTMTEKTTGLL